MNIHARTIAHMTAYQTATRTLSPGAFAAFLEGWTIVAEDIARTLRETVATAAAPVPFVFPELSPARPLTRFEARAKII